MELSLVDRVTLANQYRIRAKLEGGRDFDNFAEILERGYESLYPRVFEGSRDPIIPESVGEEVEDIFDMYRALTSAYEKGATPPPQAYHPRFDGFDGNNDPHYGIGHFMVHELGLWQELQDRPMNSHSMGTLPTYQRMLGIWDGLGRPHSLTQEHVNSIAVGPAAK